MNDELKAQTKKGFLWSAIQRFSTQGLSFIITILVARQLTPKDYGIIGMLGIFIAVSSVFVDSGFTSALIRKQDRTQKDISTVFYFNILIGLIAYLVIFCIAPFVAVFYDMPLLTNVLRIYGLTIIINSFCAVQMTLFNINLDFKTQTKISLISIIISGSVAYVCARKGLTYWALVIQSLIASFITTTMYWALSRWRPILTFSKKSFDEMFSFGSKLLIQGLIDNTYNNIYPIVIGKVFSPSVLGNYSRAESYGNFPSVSLTGILQRVTYPVLCKLQDNEQDLANAYRKFLRLSAFIIFPLMTGLAALSKPFVLLTIGEKWSFCAYLLQILCFSIMWYPIHAINLNLLQVKGRTDLSLKLEIIKKVIGFSVLFISVPLGIVAMCFFRICTSFICLAINTYYTGILIKLGFIKQMHDLLPIIFISITMFMIVLYSIQLFSDSWLQIIFGGGFGTFYYIIMSYILNKKDLISILAIIKK